LSKNAKLEKKQGEKHNHKARQLMMQYVITLGVCIGSLALFVILSNVSFEALSVASLIDKLIRLKVDIDKITNIIINDFKLFLVT